MVAQPLPEGWAKVIQNGRRIFVDASGNQTSVAPQLWLLTSDPRLADPGATQPLDTPQNRTPMLSLGDVTCNYCSEILYRPVTTECGHNFCMFCLDNLLRKSSACVVCKKKIPKKEYSVNSMFATIVERSFPERYAARVQEMRGAR